MNVTCLDFLKMITKVCPHHSATIRSFNPQMKRQPAALHVQRIMTLKKSCFIFHHVHMNLHHFESFDAESGAENLTISLSMI